ncbi:hypothetical protein LEP1GSC043_2240 [Leptospira weilii str. Ecochallenge]|uniref:Uncharacterized protein n=1 Tax=Leptospira weilii str. Ecochallenge TaxID=1049986 RepID=N1U7H7_9LEPT|nr:hypothetical protein LEP1GSC043_2240 [Leptospira weilii str. Ecochallenge]
MGTKFQRGFVGIPTDLSSDPSTCGVGYDYFWQTTKVKIISEFVPKLR